VGTFSLLFTPFLINLLNIVCVIAKKFANKIVIAILIGESEDKCLVRADDVDSWHSSIHTNLSYHSSLRIGRDLIRGRKKHLCSYNGWRVGNKVLASQPGEFTQAIS
jgi:hypothetical protein